MFKRAFLIAIGSLFLLQCSNKLEVLAPYRESVAVFGLINQNDSVQYIRVQRVFLGEGNAYTMAQNPDSCYFKPGELTVSLRPSVGGVSGPDIVLTEAFIQTDPGIFSTNQLLYRTNKPLTDGTLYRLIIHNNKSGKEFSSSNVGLIGDFKSGLGGPTQQHSVLQPNPLPPAILPSVAICPSPGTVVCQFLSPINAEVCGLKMRFFYSEYATSSGPGVSKSIDIDLGVQYLASPRGGQKIDLSFSGDGMINNISLQIQPDPAVDHRTADSVCFLLNGAGYDVSLYNQVNSSTSFSQSKPTYTNIYEGTDGSINNNKKAVGIFSSRKEYPLIKKILDPSVQNLSSNPKTCPLKFYYNGALSTTCP
jgi:hypothetical protein